MRKPLRTVVLSVLFLACASPVVRSQTLGEVLRATQNRNQLLGEIHNVDIELYNETANGDSPSPLDPIRQIHWEGVSAFPTDTEVDALPLNAKLKLLSQAWRYTSSLAANYIDIRCLTNGDGLLTNVRFEEQEERVSVENFPRMLRMLASRLSQIKAVYTSIQCQEFGWVPPDPPGTPNYQTFLPDPPLQIQPDASGELVITKSVTTFPASENGYGCSTYVTRPPAPGQPDHSYYTYVVEPTRYSGKFLSGWIAPASFGGHLQLYTSFGSSSVNTCNGLPDKMQNPGNYRWLDQQVQAGEELSLTGNLAVDITTLTFPGKWQQSNHTAYYLRRYTGQSDERLLNFSPDGGPGGDVPPPPGDADYRDEHNGDWDGAAIGASFESRPIFVADFGSEFSATPVSIPEQLQPLQLETDFANQRMLVRLANEPANDCELVWAFPADITPERNEGQSDQGALSARYVLHARGSGQWDAVYSGKTEDREEDIQWNGGWFNPNGRWRFFIFYPEECWKPVLTQLVTRTHGSNITQLTRFKYRIDFYRADQIGPKNEMTGRYSFNGSPIETFTAENPSADDLQTGKLKITTSKAICSIDLAQEVIYGPDPLAPIPPQINSTWDFKMVDAGPQGNTLVEKKVVVTRGNPLTVVEETSLDGQKLPKVTTTYINAKADPLEVFERKEDSETEGTLTTSYQYDWVPDDDRGYSTTGYPYYPSLNGITRSGGINPFSASYDNNELLTSFVSGSTRLQIGYAGLVVTRTEKFGDQNVRVSTTTYAGDMTSASTTVGGVSDAPANRTQSYPGGDGTNPWGLKLVDRDDGTLTTYSYDWSGDDFEVTMANGRGSSESPDEVTAGTLTTTLIDPAGTVISTTVHDIESQALLDFSTATEYATGTLFPTKFSRPLNTTEQYTYDVQGRVINHTDQLGVSQSFAFDALGRLTNSVRGGLTWDIYYNPTHLGRYVTVNDGQSAPRSIDEFTSPFGMDQALTISGPESVVTERTEDATTISTNVQNFTTAQNTSETIQKANLATAITGNATEPRNIGYTFPGSGWQTTTTHGSDPALAASAAYDALGRVTEQKGPNPTGSGTATTTYAYTGGQLTSTTDPAGMTQYEYAADGSLQKVSLGNRWLSVVRSSQGSGGLAWTCSDASGTLWQKSFDPSSGVTTNFPWGLASLTATTTPSINGAIETFSTVGPKWSQSASWQDGSPLHGEFSAGSATGTSDATPNAFGQITSFTTKPGSVAGNQQTTTFSSMGLPTGTSGLVDTSVDYDFDGATGITAAVTRNGHVKAQSMSPKGDFVANASYGEADALWSLPAYAVNGITRTLTTTAGSATFTWNLAGLLTQRQFPDGSAESFGYDAAGHLTTWTTPRASFAITPNVFGQPTAIKSGTKTLATLDYDSRGQLYTINDAAGSRTLTFVNGQLTKDSNGSGVLANEAVEHVYDSLGRLQDTKLPGGKTFSYSYAANGDLTGVTTAGGTTGTWSNFDAGTGQAKHLVLGALATDTAYDGLGRVSSRASTAGGNTLSYGYGYDGDGHCQSRTAPEGSWTYGYDANGYLHTASGGGQLFSYNVDEAGRLDHQGVAKNDYRPGARLNSSTIQLFGSVTPGATVEVNNVAVPVNATTGKFSLTDAPATVGWHSYLVRGTLAPSGTSGTNSIPAPNAVSEVTRQAFLPPATETLGYTAGSRTSDARWSHSWNELDQLSSTLETNVAPGTGGATRLDFIYDLQGRRVEKRVTQSGQPISRTTTLYDGWRPMMDIDYGIKGESARRYYTWGPDVSGTLDGAAGIGGLLEILEVKGSVTMRSLPVYDGQGNVVGLVDAVTGAQVATYQYGPFGEVLSVDGERVASCPFRFQTKRYDDETGLCYFGKRYYDAKTQTWLSRDPLREGGGVNLYAYCGNNPVTEHDPIGLELWYSWQQARADLGYSLDTINNAFYGSAAGVFMMMGTADAALQTGGGSFNFEYSGWNDAVKGMESNYNSFEKAGWYRNTRFTGAVQQTAAAVLPIFAGKIAPPPITSIATEGATVARPGTLLLGETSGQGQFISAGSLPARLLAKADGIPTTGVPYLDGLAVESPHFPNFLSQVRKLGFRIASAKEGFPFPSGIRASFLPTSKFVYNPEMMTVLDMIHETEHLFQMRLRLQIASKFRPQLFSLKNIKRMEKGAYSAERTILDLNDDVNPAYIEYLDEMGQ